MILKTKLKGLRREHWLEALEALPQIPELYEDGANGEELATDEAAVWKRVIDYRVALTTHPTSILEMYAGLNIGTLLFEHACPDAQITSCTQWENEVITDKQYDLIDIDPFGQPWDAIDRVLEKKSFHDHSIIMITNGEAMSVARGLKNTRHETKYKGRDLNFWVVRDYLPLLEERFKMPVRFFYVYPSSVRAVLSKRSIPSYVFEGCPMFMWWLSKYVPEFEEWARYI